MNNLAAANVEKRDEMVAMWKAWATKTEVAFPKAFNMYRYLNEMKKKKKDQKK